MKGKLLLVTTSVGLSLFLFGCGAGSTGATQAQPAPDSSYAPKSDSGPDAQVQEAKTLRDTIQQQVEAYDRKMAAADFPGEKDEGAKAILDNCDRLETSANALLNAERLSQTSGAQREDIEGYLKFAKETRAKLQGSTPSPQQ